MMYILVDIGNTRIKWMVLGDEREIVPQEVLSNASAHHGNFKSAVHECFSVITVPTVGDCSVVVSNVAGLEAREAIESYFEERFNLSPQFIAVTRSVKEIQNKYEKLSELGVDRWVAIIGARQLKPEGAVIVINCGTAITVDFLDGLNVFRGGAILPGFDMALSSLSNADGIGLFDLVGTNSICGVNTKDCVRLGVFSACVGGVERVVSKICSTFITDELDELSVVVSGGAAQMFLDATSLDCEYDPNIIIRGLHRLSK